MNLLVAEKRNLETPAIEPSYHHGLIVKQGLSFKLNHKITILPQHLCLIRQIL